jgi:hypothetical protein
MSGDEPLTNAKLLAKGPFGGDVYRKLLEKVEQAPQTLGGQLFDVLGVRGRSLLTRRLTCRAPRSAPPGAAMTNRGEPVLDLDYFRRFRVQ